MCAKIYDHACMFNNQRERYENADDEVRDAVEKYKGKLADIEKRNETKLNEMRKQYTTILGILAAIIVAFTGGIELASGAFAGIAGVKGIGILKYAAICILIAVFFYDLITYMFDFVREMNKEGIPERKKNQDEDNESKLKRLWAEMPKVRFLVNIVLFLAVAALILKYLSYYYPAK